MIQVGRTDGYDKRLWDEAENSNRIGRNCSYGYNPFAVMTFDIGMFPDDWEDWEIEEYQRTGVIPKTQRMTDGALG